MRLTEWVREKGREMRDWDEMRSWGQMDNAPSVPTLFIIYLISIVHGIFLLARAMVVSGVEPEKMFKVG